MRTPKGPPRGRARIERDAGWTPRRETRRRSRRQPADDGLGSWTDYRGLLEARDCSGEVLWRRLDYAGSNPAPDLPDQGFDGFAQLVADGSRSVPASTWGRWDPADVEVIAWGRTDDDEPEAALIRYDHDGVYACRRSLAGLGLRSAPHLQLLDDGRRAIAATRGDAEAPESVLVVVSANQAQSR